MQPLEAYRRLYHRARECFQLRGAIELLEWDQLTYMPRGGVDARSEALAYLAGRLHELSTAPECDELLRWVEESDLVADREAAPAVCVRGWRRAYDREVCVPRRLVEELSTVTTHAQQAWAAAREDNDFAAFLPWLEQVVERKREEAAAYGAADLYQALFHEFEPDLGLGALDALQGELRVAMLGLLDRVRGSRVASSDAAVRRTYPVARQRALVEQLVGAVGFDRERGRLDTTHHPFFSAIGPADCRITTRFDPADFSEGFFSVLHELGHALYEQGLDAAWAGTPAGSPSSPAMHEAQARLWEVAIGRRRSFWSGFFPRVGAVFPNLRRTGVERFYVALHHVAPSANRVRADELTYDLHILLRTELERALIGGELLPRDLPGAWNERSLRYLGVRPANDREGCLQDSHWSAGQFGYFPAYTVGNTYAAQLVAAAERALGDLDGQLARGDFAPLREWLARHVYRHGQRYSAPELVARASGAPLSCSELIAARTRKFAELYSL